MHNDLILPLYQGEYSGTINKDGRVFIGNTSLIKYMQKHMNSTRNRNKISCGCETCISAMLLQYDLNKWRLTQLEKSKKLYIIVASTRILQIPKKNYDQCNNQIFPNNSDIHIRACNAV